MQLNQTLTQNKQVIPTFQSLNTSLTLCHNQQWLKTLSSHCKQHSPRVVDSQTKGLCHLHKCKKELGNWKTRRDNTFTKVVPNKTEIKHLERIAASLVKENPVKKPENYLWECNRVSYSVARAWKRKHQRNSNDNRHGSNNSQSNFKHHRKPKEVKKIEENMQLCRRELSQLTAEIERIRSNRPLLRKTKHNRHWMEKEISKKNVGITELEQMKETDLNKIRIVKK